MKIYFYMYTTDVYLLPKSSQREHFSQLVEEWQGRRCVSRSIPYLPVNWAIPWITGFWKQNIRCWCMSILSPKEYDLGIVAKNEMKKQKVLLKNTDNVPFVIKGVTTSCDCTTAEYDWKEIAPNEQKDRKSGVNTFLMRIVKIKKRNVIFEK